MLVHTGKKDFQCEVCEKKFSQKAHLQSHMLTHTKVKAHECDICYKKFSRKDTLDFHFRIIHFGEKPYGCKECDGKWYADHSGRNYHLRTQHKELSKDERSELKCQTPKFKFW